MPAVYTLHSYHTRVDILNPLWFEALACWEGPQYPEDCSSFFFMERDVMLHMLTLGGGHVHISQHMYDCPPPSCAGARSCRFFR